MMPDWIASCSKYLLNKRMNSKLWKKEETADWEAGSLLYPFAWTAFFPEEQH